MPKIDIVKFALERRKIWENARKNIKDILVKVKEVSEEVLKDENVKVILFGSTARGDFDTFSDIDVLVVSEKVEDTADDVIEKSAKIKVKLRERIGELASPLEIHVASNELFERWYKRFLCRDEYFVLHNGQLLTKDEIS